MIMMTKSILEREALKLVISFL